MNLKHALLAGTLAVLTVVGAAYAQTVVQNQLSGNETWNVGQGPGGPGGFITSNMIRNSTAMTSISGSGAATSVGIGGTIVWVGTAPTTWAVTLPTAPPNGTVQTLTSDTTLSSRVTVTAGTGDTISTGAQFTSATLTALSVTGWQYLSSSKTWFRNQ